MKKGFFFFVKKSTIIFFQAIFNIFIFLPYFFSVTTLLKTLFFPWKNLVAKNNVVGFSLEEWLSVLCFNLVSRAIGFSMRLSVLLFYFCLQLMYVILLPLIIFAYFMLLPVIFIISLFEKSEEEKKTLLRNEFISRHLLNNVNYPQVCQWFEFYYEHYCHKSQWWKTKNLLSIPPLCRDWSVGYTPVLDQFSEELTNMDYQLKIIQIVDREKEIANIETLLTKNREANVIIVGEEGVGKHTIIDAMAKKIYEGKINPLLLYKRVLKLNLEKILNKKTDQKQKEFFFEELLKEANEAKNIILMIENLDKYVVTNQDRIDLSISIEKFAKSPSLQFITTTTPFFYQKYIYINDKINRIFTKVTVKEIEEKEAEEILMHIALIFEIRNQICIPYETIKNTIDKSEFYITNIPFPEKAIDLLDNACAYYNTHYLTSNKGRFTKNVQILPEIIDLVLSEKTIMPTQLTEDIRNKLLNLENLLSSIIVFQKEAVEKLAAAIRRSFILLGKRKKPLATFLFLGPTGVGKTFTAKALTEIFFKGEKYLLRFDMSLYQSKKDIPNLIGSIETGEPGLLTKAVRDNPYGVLLLDEIEKADKDLINIFLTVLDEGYFFDGFGKKVDCHNLIVIATSNAASDFLYSNASPATDYLINHLVSQKIFSPEFLNRFDGIVIYKPLTKEAFLELAKRLTFNISKNIAKLYKVNVQIADNLLQNLVDKSYNKEFGARDLERIISQEVESKIAKLILENKVKAGETITL